MTRRRALLFLTATAAPALLRAQPAAHPVVLIVTADASDYLLAAGGTIAGMIERGATAYLIRVTNDEVDSYDLPPVETARRTGAESEQAAKILGIKDVLPLGYRAANLGAVSFTEIRDRLVFCIRHYQPQILFIPNPYAEYDRVLDRYFAGRAAEDAWRAVALENFAPPQAEAGLQPHLTPEVYYYSQPLDPRRREPESTATFVPEPKVVDISTTFERKLRAVEALKTINSSMARRLKDRFTATHRRLPLLDTADEKSVNRLVEVNVRGLAKLCARGTSYSLAEEFRYAGVEFRIPSKYRSSLRR
ncbi:MAG TPA: PIG-L family deacetylase [Bryobacterales bacterium]|nr:PIG-L family deacetylase [Bryobacterales bacterium]